MPKSKKIFAKNYAKVIKSSFARGAIYPNDFLRDLIANGYSLDACDSEGKTILHYAAEYGALALIKHLKDVYPDDFQKLMVSYDNDKLNPVERATFFCKNEALRAMLKDSSFDINKPNKSGKTALHYVSTSKKRPQIKTFAQEEIEIPESPIDDNLINTTVDEKVYLLETLLQHGARIDIKDKEGDTALHQFAQTGETKLLNQLKQNEEQLKNAASIPDKKGYLPCQLAVMKGLTASVIPVEMVVKQNDISLKTWNALRNLQTVFNSSLITNQLKKIDSKFKNQGGWIEESLQIIQPDFDTYIDDLQLSEDNLLKHLGDSFKRMLRKDKIFPIDKKIYLHETGMIAHSAIACFIKEKLYGENNGKLIIFDRGAFVDSMSLFKGWREKGLGNFCVGRNLTVTLLHDDAYKKYLDHVHTVKNVSEAKKIIFKTMPAKAEVLLNTSFPPVKPPVKKEFDDLFYQKRFKRGMCFYENFKAVLRYIFSKRSELDGGDALYKAFDLRLHIQRLLLMLNDFNEQDTVFRNKYKKNYIEIYLECMNIIQEKYDHLLKMVNDDKIKDHEKIDKAFLHLNKQLQQLNESVKRIHFPKINLIENYDCYLSNLKNKLQEFINSQSKNDVKYDKLKAIQSEINANNFNPVFIHNYIQKVRKIVSEHRVKNGLIGFFNLFRDTNSLNKFNEYFDKRNEVRSVINVMHPRIRL